MARLATTASWREWCVIIGATLVIVGVVLLLDSLGVLEGVSIGELWPVIPIALGVAILYDRVRRSWRRR